ncbi:hypothetical protein EJB05_48569, partial [Eragrostis curvula]
MDDEGWDLPTDAFVDILLRLPSSTRRRLRLVCRHWREVIDERAAPERPSRPKTLAFSSSSYSATAYLIDDDSPGGPIRELWTYVESRQDIYFRADMIGTCNGILCMCDGAKQPGGAIILANPVTGETLSLPPLPGSGMVEWYGKHEAYSFAYLPITGRYKVLHLPCYFDKSGGFNVVQVFTLGEATWRDVPVPGASCCLAAGVISIDGKTYWVTKGPERVVCFDLEDERVTSTRPLPVQAGPGYLCYLTDVRGRLGVISSIDEETPAKIEARIRINHGLLSADVGACESDKFSVVWVLGDGSDRERWTCRYRVQMHGVKQLLSRPYFVHGDFLLTKVYKDYKLVVFGHRLTGAGRLQCNEVRISQRKPGTALAFLNGGYRCPTFAYLATTEPLSVYKFSQD